MKLHIDITKRLVFDDEIRRFHFLTGINPTQVRRDIEAFANGLMTYDEFLKRCSPLMERDILSDESILELVKIKEVREGASSDIDENLKKAISENLYHVIKSRFELTGGLMTAATALNTSYLNKYSDIIGEVEKPSSEGGRIEKEVAGLYTDHAYTVLGVEEDEGHYFVKIRNPWGHGQRYDRVTSNGKIESEYDADVDVGSVFNLRKIVIICSSYSTKNIFAILKR